MIETETENLGALPREDGSGPVGTSVSQTVRVQNELGLHARPAAKLALEAQKFAADIRLALGGQSVDAKSILDILSLAAGRGSGLEIRAQGEDAGEAVQHLVWFFESRFGEDK